jgi:hypothetical protein
VHSDIIRDDERNTTHMLLPVAAVKFIDEIQTQPNLQVVPVATIAYRVFYHGY